MNKFFLIVLVSTIFIVSCKTNSHTEYVKPDYSDVEILQSEIDRIERNLEQSPIDSLWESYLLYSEINHENGKALFDRCVAYVQKKMKEFYTEEKWLDVLKIAESIITLNDTANCDILLSEEITNIVETAKNEYLSLVQLKESTEDTISTFITGVVTVWVDLGVKVEGGVGYVNRSIGSGFFIDERGYLITNHHVIKDLVDPEYEGYAKLYIKLSHDNETRIPATVIGWDETLDLALLKTEVTPPYVFTLGSSENIYVGNQIYAIGSPAGLENTITSGIVSTFDRNLLYTASVMQIDAAVNPGNSGGPLISSNGEVQGIVFAGLPEFEGLNFAIPIEYLKSVLLKLYSGGEVTHSWIGAYGKTIKKYPSDLEGIGVEVLYTMSGGPANLAGIEIGDIITSINGNEIHSIEELQFMLISTTPDTISTIGVKKTIDSEEVIIPVYFAVRPMYPGYEIYLNEPVYKTIYPIFGMELLPASARDNKKFTVQSIVKGSIADEASFSVHDPVEIRDVQISPNNDQIYIETFTKKRKNGYFEVNIGVAAPLDSSFIF